jgi:hypothetical protein
MAPNKWFGNGCVPASLAPFRHTQPVVLHIFWETVVRGEGESGSGAAYPRFRLRVPERDPTAARSSR